MKILSMIPLFLIVLIAYNVLLLVGDAPAVLETEIAQLPLLSGVDWSFSVADIVLMLSLVLLYLEILRATGTSAHSVGNHVLSVLTFVGFLVEFLVVAEAGNSTFLLIGLMALLDVVAGFTVTIIAARRDVAFGGAVGD